MANDNNHGGYRPPAKPAPVSNPGRESARTDRGPTQMSVTGGSYGSSQAFQQQEAAAKMAPPSPSGVNGAPPSALSKIVGMDAPSAMPNVPVTDGAAAGPGVGPEAMFGQQIRPDSEEAQALGDKLKVMVQIADDPNSTPAFKRYVRQIIASLP